MRSEAELRAAFDVIESEIAIGSERPLFLLPRDTTSPTGDENPAGEEKTTFWGQVWASSEVLAAYLLEQAGLGRSLLELGCGLGVVAWAAVRAGFKVTATDNSGPALEFAVANVKRLTGEVIGTRFVDWRAWPPDLGKFDVVAASDVIYDVSLARLVAEGIKRSLTPHSVAYVADPNRLGRPAFLARCRELRLETSRERVVSYPVGSSSRAVTIFQVRRRSNAVSSRRRPAPPPFPRSGVPRPG